MKVSVLLPTRNGGAQLAECVHAVLDQDCSELELVVSDNANVDQTPEVLAQFSGDSRLKVIRSESPLSVAENWNRALAAASGDYLLMIGDDDLLLPSFVPTIRAAVEEYGYLDCITYNAYSFVAPHSLNGDDRAFYSHRHFDFGPEFLSDHLINESLRRQIVIDLFRFRPRLPLNIQTTVVSRKAYSNLNEPVFRAPFPDQFALCGLLLTAERWLYLDRRLLVIGVSPKSFGHFIYSGQSDAGLAYLGVNATFPGRLPGNELLNGMHRWLTMAFLEYKEHLPEIEVSRRDYVARQIWAWYSEYRRGIVGGQELAKRLRLLGPRDYLGLTRLAFDRDFLNQAWRRLRKRRRTDLIWPGLRPLPGVETIAAFQDFIADPADD